MKILFIACYSPFINNSAAIETLQYLNNLADIEGNEVHLLTARFPENSIYYDEKLKNMLDNRVVTHIISCGSLLEKAMPRKNIVVNSIGKQESKPNEVKKIIKNVKKAIAVPDIYFYWSRKATAYGKNLMKEIGFDVIFSMHEPPSSHICAMNIKQDYPEVPWITYWSDPWVNDPSRDNIGDLRRKYESKLEESVVRYSDKFVFVTEENRWDFVKKYKIDENKTFLINRGYDREMYETILSRGVPGLIDRNKINIVHTGEIYSELRDARPLIKALETLKEEKAELYSKLNILFFGNITDIEIENKLKGISAVKVMGRVPYEEAVSYIVNSDVLVVFGNKNSKQIPAKIYDYFGSNADILVILGDETDPIQAVVKNEKKCIVSNNDQLQLIKSLELIEDRYYKGEKSEPLENYEWKNISKILFNIIRE